MKINIPEFEKAKVLVVGDIILDRYWSGSVARISPEAPVPVVNVNKFEDRLGGAANVASNVKALGSAVTLLGLVGKDQFADIIEDILVSEGINSSLIRLDDFPTISKLRVMGHNQQLIRLDFEKHFSNWQEDLFLDLYRDKLAKSDLVILSDYGKGSLLYSKKLITLARELNKPVLVDPKSKDFAIYHGATVITPNLNEFEAVVGVCSSDDQIEAKGKELLNNCGFEAILVTRGAEGMSLISKNKPAFHLPTEAREVFDVTGAGDTVIATLGAAMAAGDNIFDAMVLANIAAGQVVRKVGTSTVSAAELRHAISKQQNSWASVLEEEVLLCRLKDERASGKKVVMTNGCFDILHVGHIKYLEQAKSLGDILVVAVNDDASVKRLKGNNRPINKLADRMLVLGSLSALDWVVPFSEDTPERLIQLVSPDILVKGGDYQVGEIAGASYVLSHGGKVEILPFEEGFSTSSIISKIEQKF